MTVGTKYGVLDRQLERNALEATKIRSVSSNEVLDVALSLRESVKKNSVGSGQDFDGALQAKMQE